MHSFRDNEVLLPPDMTSSWFLRQWSIYANLHDGLWNSDHDFLIAFHSNFLSAMHDFRDNDVLLQTGYYVIMISIFLSTIGIVDISYVSTFLISTIPIVAISKAQSQQYQLLILATNCWYPQFKLSIWTIISTINCWCRYWQFELRMSKIGIVANGIVDMNNVVHCWYGQFELSISLIQIVDIDNWY